MCSLGVLAGQLRRSARRLALRANANWLMLRALGSSMNATMGLPVLFGRIPGLG
jgi:hypothetical protein